MSANLKAVWPMNVGGAQGSLEAKRPDVDNGLDVPDPARYYSAEFMAKEWRNLWPRVWLLAGVASDIPEEGDYVTFDIGPESFVIVRQADRSIRAFYNVCPHRGNTVCMNERGSTEKFTCSFHGWQYGIDGKLCKISDEHSFNPKLIAHRPGLSEVRCDTLGGIIFINMDGKAVPLREYIGLPPRYIEQYEVDKMHVVHHVKSAWKANWKTGVDAFYETYHLPHIHPQTQGVMEDYSQYDLYPNGGSRMIVPIGLNAHGVKDQDKIGPYLEYMMKEGGVDPAAFKGTARDARVAIQKSKRERAQHAGLKHYDNFTDGQLTDSWATGLFPNVQMGMHPEGVFIMRFLPDADDPNKFYYETMILYRHVDDPNYTVPGWMGLPQGIDTTGATRPNVIHVPLGTKPDLGEVLDQDSDTLPWVQRGLRSRGFKGPLWSEQEQRLRHFHRELDRYIAGEK